MKIGLLSMSYMIVYIVMCLPASCGLPAGRPLSCHWRKAGDLRRTERFGRAWIVEVPKNRMSRISRAWGRAPCHPTLTLTIGPACSGRNDAMVARPHGIQSHTIFGWYEGSAGV